MPYNYYLTTDLSVKGRCTMRTLLTGIAVVLILALMGSRTFGQEVIPAPNAVEGTQAGAADGVNAADPAQQSVVTGPDSWRYRWSGGRWWYWTPAKRWMWYNGDGQWVESTPTPSPYRVYQPVYPGYHRPYYYPGVAVGVRPYGDVGVAVGRRVGVDVWGGHGAVRVGRIGVGW
jgi:hypothetical protein